VAPFDLSQTQPLNQSFILLPFLNARLKKSQVWSFGSIFIHQLVSEPRLPSDQGCYQTYTRSQNTKTYKPANPCKTKAPSTRNLGRPPRVPKHDRAPCFPSHPQISNPTRPSRAPPHDRATSIHAKISLFPHTLTQKMPSSRS